MKRLNVKNLAVLVSVAFVFTICFSLVLTNAFPENPGASQTGVGLGNNVYGGVINQFEFLDGFTLFVKNQNMNPSSDDSASVKDSDLFDFDPVVYEIDSELVEILLESRVYFTTNDIEIYAGADEINMLVEFIDYQDSAEILDAVNHAGGTLNNIFKIIPTISVTVERDNIFSFTQILKERFNVKSFEIESIVFAHLDDSVEMVLPTHDRIWLEDWAHQPVDGNGVRIAILDTGINENHPDLVNKVVAERDFTNDGTTEDLNGHGTHCASIAAGTGVVNGMFDGVAPQALLMNGKVLSQSGIGLEGWIISGIDWAIDNDAYIISLSLGAPGVQTNLNNAANNAVERGVVITTSSGNDGPNYYTVGSPGRAERAITVGSNDKTWRLAQSSSRGPIPTTEVVKPDVTAPGVGICAARGAPGGTIEQSLINRFGMNTFIQLYLLPCGSSDFNTAQYISLSGTSMAAPHVAGAAALLIQIHPDWTPEKIKSSLVQTSRPLNIVGRDYDVFQQGAGIIDIFRAIRFGGEVAPPVIHAGFYNTWEQNVEVDFTGENSIGREYCIVVDPEDSVNINDLTGYVDWFVFPDYVRFAPFGFQDFGMWHPIPGMTHGVYSTRLRIDYYPNCDFGQPGAVPEEILRIPMSFVIR